MMMSKLTRVEINQAVNTLAEYVDDNATWTTKQHGQFFEDMKQEATIFQGMEYKVMDRTSEQWVYNTADENPLYVPDFENRLITGSKLSNRTVQLDTKVLRGRIILRDELVRENLAGNALIDVSRGLVAKAVARQLERLVVLGDTTLTIADGENAAEQAGLAFYKQLDGLIKFAVDGGKRVNQAGAEVDVEAIGNLLALIPPEFQQDLDKYVLYLTPQQFQRMRNTIANRLKTDFGWTLVDTNTILSPQGLKVKKTNGLNAEFTYGDPAVTLAGKSHGLLFRPEDVMIGNYANGLRWTPFYDGNLWQFVLNFEMYFGMTHRYPTSVVDLYNVPVA